MEVFASMSKDKVTENSSFYPLEPSDFYKSIMKDDMIVNVEENYGKNCVLLEKINQDCTPSVPQGYNKPIKEECTMITGTLNDGPDKGCTSIWNNMTKRKSLVKDY